MNSNLDLAEYEHNNNLVSLKLNIAIKDQKIDIEVDGSLSLTKLHEVIAEYCEKDVKTVRLVARGDRILPDATKTVA